MLAWIVVFSLPVHGSKQNPAFSNAPNTFGSSLSASACDRTCNLTAAMPHLKSTLTALSTQGAFCTILQIHFLNLQINALYAVTCVETISL
jgi:hypothetical protein